MTQPIQEPTEQRQIGQNALQLRQLARRPPVSAGAAAIPAIWEAEQWSNTLPVTSGTWQQVTGVSKDFDEWTNSDTSIWQDSNTGLGSGVTGAALLQAGIVTITMEWDWATSWTGANQAGRIGDGINVFNPTSTEMGTRTSYTGGADYGFSITKRYPTIEYREGHGGSGALPTFTFYIAQASGVSKTVQVRTQLIYWPNSDQIVSTPV